MPNMMGSRRSCRILTKESSMPKVHSNSQEKPFSNNSWYFIPFPKKRHKKSCESQDEISGRCSTYPARVSRLCLAPFPITTGPILRKRLDQGIEVTEPVEICYRLLLLQWCLRCQCHALVDCWDSQVFLEQSSPSITLYHRVFTTE